MHIIAGDRGSGKTTELVEWLLQGKAIPDYPGWSRLIVCEHDSVARITNAVKYATFRWPDARQTYDVRKAIISYRELEGMSYRDQLENVDYAVDDIDHLFALLLHADRPPAVITLTGTATTLTGTATTLQPVLDAADLVIPPLDLNNLKIIAICPDDKVVAKQFPSHVSIPLDASSMALPDLNEMLSQGKEVEDGDGRSS